jgi:type II secretory ATPase GspE/PulE/Tfp pilus assembly ATPase PilB-like protein
MGVESYLLASCVRGVLAQRLVRKLCQKCRKKTPVTELDLARVGASAGELLAGKSAWAATGCEECLEGYRGRSGLFELMVLDEEMQDIVRVGGAGKEDLRRIVEKHGMISLAADGAVKVLAGVTSLSEVAAAVG